jgi:hypothetical protein
MAKMLFRRRGYLALFLIASALSAEEFSRSLSPAEFAAAGLAKLSPAELAQLDALVQARDEAGPAADQTEKAEAAKNDPQPRSLRERLRVVLTPGTEIAYRPVETQLVGSFRGYKPGHVFTLANGQRWRVVEGKYWSPAKTADQPRKVVVRPGVLGSFFLEIEDGGRPKVIYVDRVK